MQSRIKILFEEKAVTHCIGSRLIAYWKAQSLLFQQVITQIELRIGVPVLSHLLK